MRLSLRSAALGVAIVVLLLSAGRFQAVVGAGINPKHDFGCAKCHSTHQAKGKRLWSQTPPGQTKTGTMLIGSDALCYSCHQKQTESHMFEAGFSHPTGIPVKRAQVPPQLPTSRVKSLGEVITCSSCHDPHTKAAKMLRIPMENDQLCLACHRFQ